MKKQITQPQVETEQEFHLRVQKQIIQYVLDFPEQTEFMDKLNSLSFYGTSKYKQFKLNQFK